MARHLGAFAHAQMASVIIFGKAVWTAGPGISQEGQLREFWQEFFALNVVVACLLHAVVAPAVGAVLDACRSGSAQRLRELCGALPGQPRDK
jgi:hypothetical protein